MRQGARIITPKEPEHRVRQYCIYYQPNTDICRKVHVHNNCRCNEVIALRNRVLFDCPWPEPVRIAQCKTIARAIADWLPKRVPDYDGDWIQPYQGRKRRKYQQAMAGLAIEPLRRSDSYVAAFIKAEKIFEVKDPRLIQARSARYNCAIAAYLKPIEHELYNIKGTGRLKKWLPPGRLIAKGLNMERRAQLIHQKMGRFTQPLAVSIDASRFDAHVTKILEVEHLVYKRYWNDPNLQRLLDWQVNNRGRTSTGVRYRLRYSRMSGDMNTALGNCLISVIMAANVMRRLGLKPHSWDMVCDGDDVVLFFDKDHHHLIHQLPAMYLEHGFPIKVENITDQVHCVQFCQGYPIDTAMGPRMVAHPTRVLSRALVGVKHWDNEAYVPKYLSLIGYCELAIHAGCPILQEFALTILSWGSHLPKRIQKTGRVIKALREERTRPIAPLPITDDARVQFEDATGVTIEQQRCVEAALRALARHRHATKEAKTTDQPPSLWGPSWAIEAAAAYSSPKERPVASRLD